MQKKIRKAIIPAAGFGTRVLPASKAIPKELIPIVDKPSIQYIVEEAVASGIEDILIISSFGKSAIMDHFDRNFELEYKLKHSDKNDILKEIVDISYLANISYIRQKEIKGLGDAVLQAKNFVSNEPFVVLYGDDVITSDYPVTNQLIDAYEKYNLPCVAIKPVSSEDIHKYSSLSVNNITDNIYKIDDMIEKPKTPEDILSLFSILGRCLLTPEIFDILEKTKVGSGGELQLTDAMKVIAKDRGMIGVDFIGKRYDMGNKLGILIANIENGLLHKEIGNDLRSYLKTLNI
ncbi:MAG: UTP--glucose-1-phosphate uridylyltransferase [Oscillospiraceae bacterium]